MRLRSAAAFATLLGLAPGASGTVQAAVVVEFVWTSTNGAGTPGSSSIDAAPGDQLVGEIRITADAGGIFAYGVSLEFDTDLGNELDLVSATELLPAPWDANLTSGLYWNGQPTTQESTAAQVGNALTFEAVRSTPGSPGPTAGTYVAGEVTFDVTANVASDGDDVFTGIFHTGIDAIGDNANQLVPPVFLNASVNLGTKVPSLSPAGIAVASLLLSLGAVWALRRRRRAARA